MDTQVTNPVIAGLRDFYGSSQSAREFLTVLASWEDRPVTSVKRLQKRFGRTGFTVEREEVVEFLERLQSIGLGEYLSGDGVHRPRFVWGYPLTRLSPVASGEEWDLQPLPVLFPDEDLEDDADAPARADSATGADSARSDSARSDPERADSASDANGGSSPIKHVFRLREDFSVKMRLPADLTANEAFRLADFIKTLPFSP